MTPAAGAGAPSPEPTAPYLPPDAAQGCRYCFDPASPLLRRALTGRRPDPIPARALLDDLVFLRRLMEKVYAGYPDLLQHPEFDVDAYFREWMERVRAAGERIGFRFVGDYPEHARQPTLLFDLRDNHGGSLEYIRAWIAQARRGEWRSYARLEVVGALWPCSQWNLVVERQIRARTVGTPEAQAERERLRAEWAGGAPGPSSRLELGLQQGRAANPYAGQVFVLLNRNTGSSGELAALDLKRALGATLLGERSAGTMQYGEVRRFVLPSTGLVCQIPTKRFFFDDEVESVGVPVDAYLERIDQDAVSLIPQLDRLQTALTAGFR